MPNYNFQQDFSISQQTEKEISEKFFLFYGWQTLAFNETKDYDLLLSKDSKYLRIEIKEDFTCRKTGNVGLEYECRGRPSGISTSKASHYVYKIHHPTGNTYYHLLKSEKLKDMICEKLFFREVVGGDAGSNSKNYLFRYDVIEKNSRKLFEEML